MPGCTKNSQCPDLPMPFALPFKLKCGKVVAKGKAINGPPAQTTAIRATDIVLKYTIKQASGLEKRKSIAAADASPYVNHISPKPKKAWRASKTQNPLDPTAQNLGLEQPEFPIVTTQEKFLPTVEEHTTFKRLSVDLSGAEQPPSPASKSLLSLRRYSLGAARPATCPLERSMSGPMHRQSHSVPVSKFSSSSGALARCANRTAQLTAQEVATSARSKLHDIDEVSGPTRDQHAGDIDRGETVVITLDKPLQASIRQKGSLEDTNVMSRADRHATNKRLYRTMKAENHNLWVLLDASNRRAESMLATLHAEEQRCRDLEQSTQQLQATLDTLNRRRLMQQNATDTIYTAEESLNLEALQTNHHAEEVAQVTTELDNLRMNLARSRNSVRHLRRIADEEPPALPPLPHLPCNPPPYIDYGNDMTHHAATLNTRLESPIAPQPIRMRPHPRPSLPSINAESVLLNHIDALVNPCPAPESSYTTPSRTPALGGIVEKRPPPTPPKEKQYRARSHRARHSTDSRSSNSSGSHGSRTPELSSSNSRWSSSSSGSGSESGSSRSGSSPPTPPPKSVRRLAAAGLRVGARVVALRDVHPALRGDVMNMENGEKGNEVRVPLDEIEGLTFSL